MPHVMPLISVRKLASTVNFSDFLGLHVFQCINIFQHLYINLQRS